MRLEKRKATSAWYNPAKIKERADNGDWVKPDTVFLGESKGVPTWQYVFDTDIDNIFTAR
jgi:hypothetical protein